MSEGRGIGVVHMKAIGDVALVGILAAGYYLIAYVAFGHPLLDWLP